MTLLKLLHPFAKVIREECKVSCDGMAIYLPFLSEGK